MTPAFTGVPVQEGLAAEHGREVLRNALEHFLDSCGVAGESHGHLQSLHRDTAWYFTVHTANTDCED